MFRFSIAAGAGFFFAFITPVFSADVSYPHFLPTGHLPRGMGEAKTDALCAERLQLSALGALTWKHFSSIGRAFLEAHRLYPSDPISRGIFLRERVGEQAVSFLVKPERLVRQFGRRTTSVLSPRTLHVTSHGHRERGYAAIPVAELNSVLFASRKDISHWTEKWDCEACGGPIEFHPLQLRENISAIFKAEHGWTGPYSVAMRMKGLMDVGNASWRLDPANGIDGGEDRIVRELVKDGLFFRSAVLAMDQPFHGTGPGSNRLSDLGALIQYQMEVDSYMGALGKPVIEFSRSGSTMTAAQRNFEYSFPSPYVVPPASLKGQSPLRAMVWMAPVHPVYGLEESCEDLHRFTLNCLQNGGESGSYIKWNPISFAWFRSLAVQMGESKYAWWKSRYPLGKKPTPVLILVGEKDEQTSPTVRKWYREFAAMYPEFVEYHEIPGAGHDMLATTEKYTGAKNSFSEEISARARATEVWRIIYRFLRKHVPEVALNR